MLLSQSNSDLPSWSSGSRRRPLTAETRVRFPMGVPNEKAHLNDVLFRFYKRVLGIERAEKLIVRWTVSPPRRESVDLISVARKQKKMCACAVRVRCIGQAARFPIMSKIRQSTCICAGFCEIANFQFAGGTKTKEHIETMCFFVFISAFRESNGRFYLT